MQRSPSTSRFAPSARASSCRHWIALAGVTLGLAGMSRTASAQATGVITGRVTEAITAVPLAASVRVTGTQIGAQ